MTFSALGINFIFNDILFKIFKKSMKFLHGTVFFYHSIKCHRIVSNNMIALIIVKNIIGIVNYIKLMKFHITCIRSVRISFWKLII